MLNRKCLKQAAAMGWIIALIIMNIALVSADEQTDWGFATQNEQARDVLLSGLSAEMLAEQGLKVRLSTLAPVFALENSALTRPAPPSELPMQEQLYHASLFDADGQPAGYALLRYNYYTPDSEYIAQRVQQDADFPRYYDEQVRDRFEIVEMKQSGASLDLSTHKRAISDWIAHNGLAGQGVTVRLVNLVDGLGYAYRVGDGSSVYYYLISQTRTREQYGLTDTMWMDASQLQDLLSYPMDSAQADETQTDEPPIGGGTEGVLQQRHQTVRLHPWVIAVAAGLLLGACLLLLFSRRNEKD